MARPSCSRGRGVPGRPGVGGRAGAHPADRASCPAYVALPGARVALGVCGLRLSTERVADGVPGVESPTASPRWGSPHDFCCPPWGKPFPRTRPARASPSGGLSWGAVYRSAAGAPPCQFASEICHASDGVAAGARMDGSAHSTPRSPHWRRGRGRSARPPLEELLIERRRAPAPSAGGEGGGELMRASGARVRSLVLGLAAHDTDFPSGACCWCAIRGAFFYSLRALLTSRASRRWDSSRPGIAHESTTHRLVRRSLFGSGLEDLAGVFESRAAATG